MTASGDKFLNLLNAAARPSCFTGIDRVRTGLCASVFSFVVLLPALLFVLSTAAYAEPSGTPQERRACSGDVQRYCKKAIPGGDLSILGCLRQNRGASAPHACGF